MHLVDFFPGPFDIRTSWRDHPHLRVIIAVPFLGFEMVGNWIVQDRRFADAFGASKDCFYGALVLIHRVNSREKVTNQKPPDEPDDNSEDEAHSFFPKLRDSTCPGSCRQYQTMRCF